ncbi:hypothetical protein D9M68_714070 [compost metagenome]
MGEFRDDSRIELDVGLHHEHVGEGLDLAYELFEHQVLVLHLVGEACRLEQALAVPGQRIDLCLADRPGGDVDTQPLIEKRQVTIFQQGRLDLLDQAVVFGVEDVMHGGQADVLVTPAITGDVVSV